MRRNLQGQAVLLTGASRGIGRCVAELLASYGARLALTSRSEADLAPLVEKFRAQGVEAYGIAADLLVPADRERLVTTAAEKLGGIDVLINNAGLCSFGEFGSSSEEVLRKIMDINFFAPVEMIRLALPYLTKSARKPAIVNVASICGRSGIPSFPEHCASKFALVGLSEALRAELTRFDVDIVLVVPGLARTDDLDKHLLRNEGRIYINWQGSQAPETVARGIVRALRWNWRETVVGWTALQVHRLRRVYPSILEGILINKVLKFEKRSGPN